MEFGIEETLVSVHDVDAVPLSRIACIVNILQGGIVVKCLTFDQSNAVSDLDLFQTCKRIECIG